MSPLDSHDMLVAHDPLHLSAVAEAFPDQLRQAWEEVAEIAWPANYRKPSRVVLAGMGGSALGCLLAASAVRGRIAVPVEIVRDYALPAGVNSKTLLIIVSFSGTTEEMLEIARAGKEAGARIAVITAGGPLAAFAKRHHVPAFLFAPAEFSPQPRYGTGFLMLGVLGMLMQAGLVRITDKEIRALVQAVNEVIDVCSPDVEEKDNPAKLLAQALADTSVLTIAAEHLSGNANTIANEINETAKQQAHWYLLPEFNHHFLEGLSFPKGSVEETSILFIRSGLYHERTRRRFAVTADLLEDMGATVVEYDAGGGSALEEIGEVLVMSFYLTWYMAVLNGVKSGAIPYVDALKKALRS